MGSPVQASLSRQLIQRLAQSQMQGGGQPASASSTPDAVGQQLSSQFSQLAGADPNLLLKASQQLKQMLVAIFQRTAFTMPEASRHAGQASKAIDSMIKVLSDGVAAQAAASPIVNSAALPQTGDMGSSPDQGLGI